MIPPDILRSVEQARRYFDAYRELFARMERDLAALREPFERVQE